MQAGPTYSPIKDDDLTRIRAVADYQFGKSCGEAVFPKGIVGIKSNKTGKIKAIYYENELLATLKPSDGYLAMSLKGASRLIGFFPPPRFRVVIMEDVLEFIKQGRNLFAKHVVDADPNIRAGEEVIVIDSKDQVIAVGRAVLNGREMKRFKIGLAVNVRRGEENRTEVSD